MTHSVLSQLPEGSAGDKVTEPVMAVTTHTAAVRGGRATRSSRRIIGNKQQDSIWLNLKYGLGMLAFAAIPPLLPGVTVRHLVIMYGAIALTVYLLAFVVALVRAMRKQRR